MQLIDYDAIKKNAQFFRGLIGSSKLCAVLKNNAYGHGLTHVARQIVELVDCFAVGSVDEAEQIRFLNKDVLVLLPQNLRNAERAIKSGFILTLDSFDTLSVLNKATANVGVSARVHLKIDSGMSRLGFNKLQLGKLLVALQDKNFSIEGVFSHFYGDTERECDEQFDYFSECLTVLQESIQKPLIRHIANSGATLLSSKYHLDMVRIGLGLYGYGNVQLIPAKKVYADVLAVKDVTVGSVAGYGAIYKCEKDTKIAVINLGYATGLARRLVGSKISINGQKCAVVAICMAMSLVNVTGIDVKVGDKAVVLGEGINIANENVIIYELLCNLR